MALTLINTSPAWACGFSVFNHLKYVRLSVLIEFHLFDFACHAFKILIYAALTIEPTKTDEKFESFFLKINQVLT